MSKPRTQVFVENGLRNWLAFTNVGTFNLSEDFKVEYVKDTPAGCLMRVTDPHLGPNLYEITVTRKKP